MWNIVRVQLSARLRDDFAAMRQYQNIPPLGDFRPDDGAGDHRFAGAGGRDQDDAALALGNRGLELMYYIPVMGANLDQTAPRGRGGGFGSPAGAPLGIGRMTEAGPSLGSVAGPWASAAPTSRRSTSAPSSSPPATS